MYKYLMLVGIFASLFSCKKDEEPTVEDQVNTTEIKCEDVDFTFATGIKPIMEQSCAFSGCHAGSGQSGVVLETFEQIKANAQEARFLIAIKRTGENGVSPMPAGGPLAAEKVKAIECWINAGYPDN